MVNSLILLGVGVFLLINMGIGLYVSRWIRGRSENYIVAGRRLILPLAAATLMAQSVDSNATLGNTDLTYAFGFWAGASLPLGLALCLFLTGLFFAKPLNGMRLMTLPDFYRIKYGRLVEVLASIIMVLSFAILLGGNLVAGGYLFQKFLGTSYTQGVLIIASIIFVYTIAGGLIAVAYTDIIQIIVAFIASTATIIFVASNFGITIPAGMGPFDFEQLVNPSCGAYINWATLLALGLGDIVAIDFMERVFAAESPETARRACFIGSLGTVVIGVPFAIVALSAHSIFGNLGMTVPEGEPILYALLSDVFPVELAVLVLAGILAASLSTGDGAILGTSAVLARNVLGLRQNNERKHVRDKLLYGTRLMGIPITLLGIYFALKVPETGMLLVLAFDVTFAGLLVPLVLGLYWSRVNTSAALAAILGGSIMRLVTFALSPQIYGMENTLLYIPNNTIFSDPVFDGLPTLISPLFSLILSVIVAYATQSTTFSLRSEATSTRRIVAAGENETDPDEKE